MSNRKKEITKITKEIMELSNDGELLSQERIQLKHRIKGKTAELKNLEDNEKTLNGKLLTNRRSADNLSHRLNMLMDEQEAFEYQQKVEELRRKQPSFKDCLKEELLSQRKMLDKGVKLVDIEKDFDPEKVMTQIENISQNEYAIKYGLTDLAILFNVYERKYDESMTEVIKESLNGNKRVGVIKMFVNHTRDFLNHPKVQQGLK